MRPPTRNIPASLKSGSMTTSGSGGGGGGVLSTTSAFCPKKPPNKDSKRFVLELLLVLMANGDTANPATWRGLLMGTKKPSATDRAVMHRRNTLVFIIMVMNELAVVIVYVL